MRPPAQHARCIIVNAVSDEDTVQQLEHERKQEINYDGNLRIGFCLVCGGRRAKMNCGETSKS